MKNILALILAVFFTSALAAQDKSTQKADMKKSETTVVKHECYMMKDNTLMHCLGDKAEAQKTAVTLKNGTVINTDGTVRTATGETSKLQNGECVDLGGAQQDCETMHASLMDKHQMKEEKKDSKKDAKDY
jgi:hypothetical protein